jgi:hypothetical protein
MPWWALLAVAPFFGYAVWSAFEEWRYQRRAARLVKSLHEARVVSTLQRVERPRPLDVRPALRRDRRSRHEQN